jgi:hypothetical protein
MIKDCDKLILVFDVGINGCQPEYANDLLDRVHSSLNQTFDDTVKCLIFANWNTTEITVKSLNTEKMEPEELNELVQKAEVYCKKMRYYMHKNLNGEI